MSSFVSLCPCHICTVFLCSKHFIFHRCPQLACICKLCEGLCLFTFAALFLCRRFPKISSGFYIRCLSIFQMWKPSHENWLIIFNVSDRFTDDCSAGIGGVSRSGFVHVDLSWLHKLISIHASLYCLGS